MYLNLPDTDTTKDEKKKDPYKGINDYTILPNVNIVEDDRKEIPVIFIEKKCEGCSFAIVDGF